MDVSCNLEVDVNGEEIFMVDKRTISSYSGRISKLFGKPKGLTRNLKVIFNDFPGGAKSFELMARFCYNNGNIEINPHNITALYRTAHFMEMNKYVSGTNNLIEQTVKSLEEIRYWTWPELLVALKHCQELLPAASSAGVLEKCMMDSLVGRLALAVETSPCPSTSSPDSSGFRLSCDSRSTESLRNSIFRATWWFEDLFFLNAYLIEMMIKAMLSLKFDNGVISKFLLYYQKSRLVAATSDEKQKIIEMVVDTLYTLEQGTIPFKNLLGILRAALNLNISRCSRNKLEGMIGSQLDQATSDNLLVPSPVGTNYLYDVNLVLRLLKSFLGRGAFSVPLTRLKKVASLMDLYIAEVAPDPCLKPTKFVALIRALPDSARDSYDAIYHAMDMYLKVHLGLSEEEKIRICCVLNYEKLSSEVCNQLAQNPEFPSESGVQSLISQQSKLKTLLQDTNAEFPSESGVQSLISQQSKLKTLLQDTNIAKPFIDSPCSFVATPESTRTKDDCEEIVLYSGKLDLSSENEKLRAHLQGLQWRVLELEKICRKMQLRMSKIMKSRLSGHGNTKSLPRLCS